MNTDHEFSPNWASPPGATIAQILIEREVSLAEFAEELDCSRTYLNHLIVGYAEINSELAEKLASILGGSSAFWKNRENQFQTDQSRVRLREYKPADSEWLKELPTREMTKLGWLKLAGTLAEKTSACLRYFGVKTVDEWRALYEGEGQLAAFRTSAAFASQTGAVAAWLRHGELESAAIKCKAWNPERFEATLTEIRTLTKQKDPNIFLPELQTKCAECGVALVIAKAPSGCRASGATRFLLSKNALLMLSFRYLSDDHFWFSFFHEAGHLLLHGQHSVFVEGEGLVSNSQEEEADEFAAKKLIPPQLQQELFSLGANAKDVMKFAYRAGISPGIVVGQLQHLQLLGRNQLNWLKRRYAWKES